MLDIGFGVVEEIKKIKEHGAIGHIISTRAENSELMFHAVPCSGNGSTHYGQVFPSQLI